MQSVQQLGTQDSAVILRQLAGDFALREAEATQTARRALRVAPVLTVISAGGTAFAGAAVATGNLAGGWKTAIIIVTFLATGVGAGAAALRPTERAQAAKTDAANASALLTWLNILSLEGPKLPPDEFRGRVQALQAWAMHQLGSQPYTYDGTTPWASASRRPESALDSAPAPPAEHDATETSDPPDPPVSLVGEDPPADR